MFRLSIFTLLALSLSTQAAELVVGEQKGSARAVMEAAGELKDLPYQIKWYEFPNAAPLLESLNANHLDAGTVGDAPLSFAVAAGATIKAIEGATSSGNAVIVAGHSSIKTVADLRGKKIATVKGSSGHNMALTALKKAGITADQVQFIYTTPAESTLALNNGSVDAVANWEPYTSYAIEQSKARIVADGKDYPSLSYLVATDKAIGEKREQLSDFSQRLARATVWGQTHQKQYAAVIAKLLRLPDEVALNKVRRETNTPVSSLSAVLNTQQGTIDTFIASGLIKPGLKATQLVESSFFDAQDKQP